MRNLSLGFCAPYHHSAILRLGHHSVVLQFITTQFFCDLPLGCCATCHNFVVLQLITCSKTCRHSDPQFITTHLPCNLLPLGCCAASHHALVLQLVTTQPFCNLPLSCCTTRNSVVLQSVHVLCTLVTRVQRITQLCNLSLSYVILT